MTYNATIVEKEPIRRTDSYNKRDFVEELISTKRIQEGASIDRKTDCLGIKQEV